MKNRLFSVLLLISTILLSVTVMAESESEQDSVKRGEYIFALGGCASCHTNTEGDGKPLAGGLKMETPFGVFYTPNISSDSKLGIGSWSEQDFIKAMRKGISPEGDHYYPAFPYTSYAKMTDQDLLDLKAFLDVQPAVSELSKEHELSFPFNQRSLMAIWKWLNFDNSEFKSNPKKSTSWNRGAYIVNGPSHCVECHTPRNLMGGLDTDEGLAGNEDGPDGEAVPALIASNNKEFGDWDVSDIIFSLEVGMKPDGDFLGGSMGHVIENTTSRLSEEDLKAIAEYLKSPEG
ncbi:cytochrome c [Motiliproteus sp. MSK22-1]|uniref:c-type cytochrome n=1 Tax=Motiliproteus sp. MSK22-1 TaxID=1897630 RepID=UPI0013013AB4|nr:cytochrome c [Motiliproteus sp. MSK22-1]